MHHVWVEQRLMPLLHRYFFIRWRNFLLRYFPWFIFNPKRGHGINRINTCQRKMEHNFAKKSIKILENRNEFFEITPLLNRTNILKTWDEAWVSVLHPKEGYTIEVYTNITWYTDGQRFLKYFKRPIMLVDILPKFCHRRKAMFILMEHLPRY